MTTEEIERERRTGRLAGIAGIAGIVLFVGIGAAGLADEFQGADGFAESLAAFPPESSEVLVLLLAQAIGIALFAPPLAVLFSAVRKRMDNFRPGLIGLCFAGPLFFAGSLIASYFAIDAAAGLFDPAVDLDPGVELDSSDADDVAEDIYLDQTAANVASGLRFAGQLGITFIIVYTALYAMRAGLLTRFWGTLSMALGVGVLLIGPPALLGFFLAVSLLVAGFWPGGRPPAWEAGKAIPWPKPGESPDPAPDEPEELASPEDFEGTATEVEPESERPGRRDNKRKRKRKQR
jgi:hypothetical protein